VIREVEEKVYILFLYLQNSTDLSPRNTNSDLERELHTV
jgi:hypothetical protein